MRRKAMGWLLVLCMVLAVCLSGCENPPVALEQESQPRVKLAEQDQGIQEIKSISAGKYAYECLNEEEKQLYDHMLNGILTYQEKIELPVVDVDTLERAYHSINCDYGGLFWVNGYTYTTYTQASKVISLEFSPTYTMEPEQKQAYQEEIDLVVDQWLSEISDDASDYEKARYVFESLIRQVGYREGTPESQNILSAFLYGETVCQGYACATQYLLQRLGIPCIVVSGTANNEAHAWNIVMLDGQYYHMDTTWGNSSYMNQDSQENQYINYNYMCATDQEIGRTHSLQMQIPVPACVAMEDNFFVRENSYFDSWDPDQMGQLLSEGMDAGKDVVNIKCSDQELYGQTVEYFIEEQHIADYCQGLESFYYMCNPESCVLSFSFEGS